MPRDLVEEHYAKLFKPLSKDRQIAVSVRVALGSRIIQERLGATDRDTVENVAEEPHFQCLIRLPEFQQSAPFGGFLMTHFRERLDVATCAPADIAYPTDLSLFNEAREKLG